MSAGKPPSQASSDPVNIRGQVGQLMSLGFSRQDCQLALEVCQGRLDEAALWLTHNATTADAPDAAAADSYGVNCAESSQAEELAGNDSFLQGTKVSFKAVEFKSSCVNICIIDDCKVNAPTFISF